jgi:anthranilate synthase component 1
VSHRSYQTLELKLQPGDLMSLAACWPTEFPVLFDSAAQGPLGRWSILAACPQQQLRLEADGSLSSTDAGALSRDTGHGFLQALNAAWLKEQQEPDAEHAAPQLPFRGGWVVYLSYELAAEVEPGLNLPLPSSGPPRAVALRVPAAILYDHQRGACVALAESRFADCLEAIAGRVAQLPVSATAATAGGPVADVARLQDEPAAAFERAVAAAKHYIRDGAIYQANLSRRWRLPAAAAASGAALYASLRRANPAPFAAWAQLPGLQLLSSSPERLVQVQGARIETRPIAGTRPRGSHAAQEVAALLANPKERAEHVMLIDLERNDLGRVCQAGTVTVDEFMVTETYTHVHHIVSSVRGLLRAEVTPVAVLRALFPGGTITGCPKYRCMQIIAELEGAPRGAYTGSLGYINHDGSMDFNILIRTLTLTDTWLEFRAGAGIVADSDWQLELAETQVKALGMQRALGVGLTP